MEDQPRGEVRRALFETMRLAGRHEQKITRPDRVTEPASDVVEHAGPAGHEIHLVAVVGLLRVAVRWRVELHVEGAVREDRNGQVAGWRRALRERIGEAHVNRSNLFTVFTQRPEDLLASRLQPESALGEHTPHPRTRVTQECEQQVLRPDLVVPQALCFLCSEYQNPLAVLAEGNLHRGRNLLAEHRPAFDLFADVLE